MTLPTLPDPKTTVSPKVWASTIGSFLASALVGLVLAFTSSPDVMGGLPPIVVLLITALVPTVVTFLSGYVKADPTRTGSDPA